MSQATNTLQHFPLSPYVHQEAERLGDPRTHRLRGVGIRVLMRDGDPWFVARDVCDILEIREASDAMARLDDDQYDRVEHETVLNRVGSNLDKRGILMVTESGLYSLIMGSRKPVTRPFRRWVTDEVLPSIRKTGAYAEPAAPKTRVELARELLAAEERAEQALQQAEEQRALLVRAHTALTEAEPKVQAYDALQATDRDWSMRDAAAILNRDPYIWEHFRLGQNGLFRLLREFRMVDNGNHVYAHHKQHLRLLPTTYQHPHTGEPRASEQLRLTALGLVYLQKRMGGAGPDALQLDAAPVAV